MMREVTGRRMSTLMMDTDTYPPRQMIRVSIFVDPDDILVTGDDPSKITLQVEATKGRQTFYGTIDREAWEEYEGKRRADHGESKLPWPTDGGAVRDRERMFRR